MTKEQAAKALGISPRSVIRFAQRGLLKVRYAAKENGGQIAIYDPDTVEGLRIELEAQRKRPRTPPLVRQSDGPQSESLVRGGKVEIAPFLEKLVEAVTAKPRAVPIEAQLTLSLGDAAQLSGLSRGFLLEAIKAEKLRASKDRARGWNIKRADLEAFVSEL